MKYTTITTNTINRTSLQILVFLTYCLMWSYSSERSLASVSSFSLSFASSAFNLASSWNRTVEKSFTAILKYYKTGITTTLQLQPFNGLFSRTTWVSRYQKGKTDLDFTGARRQWVAVASAGPYASLHLAPDRQPCQYPTTVFYRPDALPAAQPTASKHWRHKKQALKAE